MSEARRSGSFVTSDGVRVHFEEFGAGDPVVLIHGWAASRRFWRYQVPKLAESYRVLTLDLRGHGDSEKPLPADYTARRMARDVIDLCEHLRIRAPSVVGHSLGGLVASLVSLEMECRSLILLSPPPKVPSKVEIALMGLILTVRPLARRVITPRMFASPRPELTEFVRRESTGIPSAVLKEVLVQNARVRLPTRLLPERTTIIVGSADRVNDPAKLERLAHSAGARFVLIPGAGHNLMLERPEEVTETIIEALSSG